MTNPRPRRRRRWYPRLLIVIGSTVCVAVLSGAAVHQDAPITVTDIGPAPDAGTAGLVTEAAAQPDGALTVTDIGPTPGRSPIQMPVPIAIVDTDRTWVVQVGDYLWGIAAQTVKDRTGRTDYNSVDDYYRRLARANEHIVAGNPDLILPGQVISLPD